MNIEKLLEWIDAVQDNLDWQIILKKDRANLRESVISAHRSPSRTHQKRLWRKLVKTNDEIIEAEEELYKLSLDSPTL